MVQSTLNDLRELRFKLQEAYPDKSISIVFGNQASMDNCPRPRIVVE